MYPHVAALTYREHILEMSTLPMLSHKASSLGTDYANLHTEKDLSICLFVGKKDVRVHSKFRGPRLIEKSTYGISRVLLADSG